MVKFKVFLVPVDGPTGVLCDKKSVVKNSSNPTYMLNNIRNAICYHILRDSQAAGFLCVGWIPREFNLEYLFTNTMLPGNKMHNLVD